MELTPELIQDVAQRVKETALLDALWRAEAGL